MAQGGTCGFLVSAGLVASFMQTSVIPPEQECTLDNKRVWKHLQGRDDRTKQ